MHIYIDNIITGIVVFPFLAFFITLPYMIYQYRKFGSIPWWRTTLVYLFVFYLLCAYFLVILPLPEDHSVVVPYAQTPQLVPFHFISDIIENGDFVAGEGASWLLLITRSVFYEVAFNVLLLVPLGMFLRYYFKRTWWQTVLIGFATTLFFELSQLTGLFGWYEHPYRLFDVDDLICNTLGAWIGFLLMGPAMKVLPRVAVLNQEAREQGVRASLTRRALALVFDGIVVEIVAVIIGVCLQLAGVPLSGVTIGDQTVSLAPFILIGVGLIFFVLVPVRLRGQTLGQKGLKLVVVKPDAHPARWYQFMMRYAFLFLFLCAPLWCLDWLQGASLGGSSSEVSALADSFLGVRLILLCVVALGMGAWFISLLFRERYAKKHGQLLVLLHEFISGTRIMTVEGAQRLHDKIRVLDVQQVVALEQKIAEKGIPLSELMNRAGKSVAQVLVEHNPEPVEVLIVCGAGNNGGDGWVAGKYLAEKGYPVTLVSPLLPADMKAEPARTTALEVFAAAQTEELPLRVILLPEATVFRQMLTRARVVVDALLGTGFSGASIKEPYATWIEALNKERKVRKDFSVLAVDVPSGFSAQTGSCATPCVVADATVTLLAYKPGLLKVHANHWCGTITLARLVEGAFSSTLSSDRIEPLQ